MSLIEMIHLHRIRLNPTLDQALYFRKAAGTRRFVYNWGLSEWIRQYEAGDKPSALKLKKQFNAIKRENYSWVYEVSKSVVEGAFMDLATAFKRFFSGLRTGEKVGYPRFKSKRHSRDSFYIANDRLKFGRHWVKLPHIGKVNMTESLRFEGKVLSCRIIRIADWWFISVVVEHGDVSPAQHHGPVVGIDLGVRHLATLSDGQVFENQKHLYQKLRKLKRLQRQLSRKQPGSRNREKARQRLARQHYRVNCARNDYLHKLTTWLVDHYSLIAVERLNVRAMLKCHRLAMSLSDAALGRFVVLLKQKAQRTGTHIVEISTFFPSSKLCHRCGHKKDILSLSERLYVCDNCGGVFDRDFNASINIRNEGMRLRGAAPLERRGSGYIET